MNRYDLLFVGHVTIDEIEAKEGSARSVPGGAPFFGALAASRSGKRIAVVTRMAKEDEGCLALLKDAGIDIYLQPVAQTTHMRVVHPTENVDERLMYQTQNAGFFSLEDLSPVQPCPAHLGALTDREFTLGFMRRLQERGFRLSIDMQNFVRQVDMETGVIHFKDVPEKREIVSLADMVKLDVVEAEILTGTDDLEQAAVIVEKWGCPEIIITRSDGVLARYKGKMYFEKFSNRNSQGRTGRGDTTTGSYLVRRLDHEVEDSLKFAAALASIKMETPGPFSGTLEDVLRRMGS
ncbi:MAG: aminoimidazole riboside kinase [Syntrophorhabdus sp. PtaU1.Bin002]|nr:MAG: aminoimidazole riboside kinase [Syntrophorhabdus sp. PtaU1.Bin002]